MQILPTTLLALAVAVPATAQTLKVLPPGMAEIEGNLTHTYPFGRMTAGLQMIHDASWVSTQQGVLMGVRFRAEGSDFNDNLTGYSKAYDLTVAMTPVAAAAMTVDPVSNHGGAQPTTVFSGNLNVPNSAAQPSAPRPFAIHFPFQAPFLFDGTRGNLILTLSSADTISPPGTFPLDAVNLRSTSGEGIVEPISLGCQNAQGATLSLAIDDSVLTVGGRLDALLSTNAPGAFPTAAFLLGLRRVDLDLGVIGMPGCHVVAGDAIATTVAETGGTYPLAGLSIPVLPSLEGVNLFCQALGLAQPGSLAGAVTSDGLGLRIGSQSGAAVHGQSIFTRDFSSWFIGRTGTYVPVIELDGVLP